MGADILVLVHVQATNSPGKGQADVTDRLEGSRSLMACGWKLSFRLHVYDLLADPITRHTCIRPNS